MELKIHFDKEYLQEHPLKIQVQWAREVSEMWDW